MKKHTAILAALVGAAAAFAEEPAEASNEAAKKAPEPDFASVCSNAWVKCITDKDPTACEPGAEIKFTFTLEGVTNSIPAGKYSWKWTRSGDDNVADSGTLPLSKTPLVCTAKSAAPGTLRVFAQIMEADGKPFLKKKGKNTSPLEFSAGAIVGADALAPAAAPKTFAKSMALLKKELSKVQFRKTTRTAVEKKDAPAFVYNVSVPCAGGHAVTGLLTVPKPADTGKASRFPCRLEFSGCGIDNPVPVPDAKNMPADEIRFTIAFTPGKAEERDEAFCRGLLMRSIRAVQYLKTLPEWNGNDIVASGYGMSAVQAIWCAAADEGVTKVEIQQIEPFGPEEFSPELYAQAIPPDCRVDIARAGLYDPGHPPAAAARLWNALDCDKRFTWTLGAAGWSAPHGYKERDFVWEDLSAIRYRNMDAEHAKLIEERDYTFKDIDVEFRDKIVMEVLFNYADVENLPFAKVTEKKNQCANNLVPLQVYAIVPEKKIKDKQWLKSLEKNTAFSSIQYPVYFDAGMNLPRPDALPWFRVVDTKGVLRYNGPKFEAAERCITEINASIPKIHPLFGYTAPVLLKAEVKKLVDAKTPPHKMQKAIEGLAKKYARTDKARAAEAEHLVLGMDQAVDYRLAQLKQLRDQRPGNALNEIADFLLAWPALKEDSRVKAVLYITTPHPDAPKLAKLEKELLRLRGWNPAKTSEAKKRDAEIAQFKKKLEKFVKCKDPLLQGEAMAMEMEIDTPLEDPQQANGGQQQK